MKIVNYEINAGDKIMAGFDYGNVGEIQGDRVREVRFNHGTLSGWSLNVVPVTPEIEEISKRYYRLKEDIRNSEGAMNLNWPDISSFLERLWYSECIEMLEFLNKPPHERSNTTLKSIRKLFNKFSKSMATTLKKLRKMEVCEVRIFR
jgi:hypothetical protein